MPRRLRVFISSTMKDLANERDAVRRKLEEFNFEPVNAENMLPTGRGSWERIQDELSDCDVMVLILGESYGWIPPDEARLPAGRSVTELEYLEARRIGLPVLPFVKRLSDAGHAPDHARREGFRSRLEEWDGGLFRTSFDLAHDLADGVARALIEFLGGRYLQDASRTRTDRPRPTIPATAEFAPALPPVLVDAVRDRSAVVLIGAGVSLDAGLPAVDLFVTAMRNRIKEEDPIYEPAASGSLFFSVAADMEALLGTAELRRMVKELVTPDYAVGTTDSHRTVLGLFDLVVTTNYDDLLERAAVDDVAVVSGDTTLVDLATRPAIVKLHGSFDHPESLVLTEGELAALAATRPRMRAELVEALRRRPLVAVGSSLRDPGLVAVLEDARPELHGWVVADRIPLADRARVQRWNLDPLEGDAHAFFAALRDAVDAEDAP